MGSSMKNGYQRPISQVARGFILSTMLTGCLYGQNQQFFEHGEASPNEDGDHPGGGVSSNPAMSPTPFATATPAQVCDPLATGSDGSENRKNGIKGKLYSYEADARALHPHSSVNHYLTYGTDQNVDFFLSSLFTPTRAFDAGFMTSDGQLLQKTNGEPLLEYFAMKLSGGIQLPQGSSDKIMQFAVLSDDGSKLHMLMTGPTDSGVTIVENDGDHATRMGCSATPVVFSATSRVPFELDYYQGPRMHIALVLLWREWTPGMNANDPWCNQSGNDLFWNSRFTPSVAQSAYNDISARWQVVPSNVFYINGYGTLEDDHDNPCAN
jgi:hypothetical protein